jgi:hypothetical protein
MSETPNETARGVVSSYAIKNDKRLLLFDPLAVPSEIEELAVGSEAVVVPPTCIRPAIGSPSGSRHSPEGCPTTSYCGWRAAAQSSPAIRSSISGRASRSRSSGYPRAWRASRSLRLALAPRSAGRGRTRGTRGPPDKAALERALA